MYAPPRDAPPGVLALSVHRSIWIALLAALCPVLVCLAGILWPEQLGVHRTKTFLLVAEYLFALPFFVWLGWRERRANSGLNELAHFTARFQPLFSLAYLLITVPLAWMANLGIFYADEGAYLFQARCLRSGSLFMTLPGTPWDGDTTLFSNGVLYLGRLSGKYPFGWPAVLAAGTITNFEWLINPLLGLLLLYLVRIVAVQVLPSGQGVYASLFFLLSPLFTLNCIGFMAHVLSGVLVAGATLCYLRFSGTQSNKWALGMLLCLGACSTVRPFTAACAGLVLCVAMVWNLRRNPRGLVTLLAAGALIAAAAGLTQVYTNFQLTGNYFRTPYGYEGSGMSFKASDILASIFLYTPERLASSCIMAFPYVFILAAYAVWRRPRESRLLTAIFGALVAGHLLAAGNDSGSFAGERYYFEGFFAICILGAAGWAQLSQDLRWRPEWQRGLLTAFCVLALAHTAVCWYWNLELRSPMERIRELAANPPFQKGAVFLAYIPRRYNLNRPDKAGVLYLPDPGPPNRQAAASRLGFSNWAALQYSDKDKIAYWTDRHTAPP